MRIQNLLFGLATLVALTSCSGDDPEDEAIVEICANLIDDDGDGLIDCDDVDDCASTDPLSTCFTGPPACAAGNEASIPVLEAGEVAAPFTLADLTFAGGDAILEPGDRDCWAFDPVEGQFYILYVEHDRANPDTVVQVFDSEFNLIGDNDNLPYSVTGTDSGFEFVAQSNERLYFQVLEFSDWDPDLEPEGGNGYKYEVLLSAIDQPELNEDGATDNDTFTAAAANAADDLDDILVNPYGNVIVDWLPGTIGEPGDVDIIQFEVLGDRRCQISSFGHSTTGGFSSTFSAWQPQLDFFFEACDPFGDDCTGEDVTLVASTNDPAIYGSSVPALTLDTGIGYPVPRAGIYYLRVSDSAGGGSPLHAYQLWINCLFTDLVQDFESSSTEVTDATSAELVESDETPGFWAGEVGGALDSTGFQVADGIDSFRVTEGLRAGATFTVFVETTTAGSSLDDAVVKLWRDNGDDTVTELASATGANPVLEHTLADGNNVFVTFESESGRDAPDAFYVGGIFVTDEPLETL